MSNATPTELNASTIIALIESGSYPRDIVLTFARGFLPLEQHDLVPVLSFLSLSADAEVAAAARAALADIPSRIVAGFASNESANPQHLELLSRATADPALLEILIRNKAFSDAAVVDLARRADATVQEVIVINQQRILRAPEILDALLENPALSADARRRANETREEFFIKRARAEKAAAEIAAALGEPLADVPIDDIADLLSEADYDEPSAKSTGVDASEVAAIVPGDDDSKKAALWARIQSMSVAEKVLLAFRGDRGARMILIRERNKLVCSAAIRNPRITDTEVEQVAGMRNVEEEVLRLIGLRRDWTSKYPIMLALCRNPKAPLGVVLPLINRLALRDLKGLKDDKNVSDGVRQMARKTFMARSQKS